MFLCFFVGKVTKNFYVFMFFRWQSYEGFSFMRCTNLSCWGRFVSILCIFAWCDPIALLEAGAEVAKIVESAVNGNGGYGLLV